MLRTGWAPPLLSSQGSKHAQRAFHMDFLPLAYKCVTQFPPGNPLCGNLDDTVRSKNNLLSKLLCCFVLTFTNVSIWRAHMTLKFTDEHWILCHYPCYGPVCTWTCPRCQLISAEISYRSGSPIVPKETSGLTLGSLGQAVDFGGAMEPVIRTELINFINSMILRNCMKLQEPLCSYVQAS
jgi:hypothetical protein